VRHFIAARVAVVCSLNFLTTVAAAVFLTGLALACWPLVVTAGPVVVWLAHQIDPPMTDHLRDVPPGLTARIKENRWS
jgi:hypothetical protein